MQLDKRNSDVSFLLGNLKERHFYRGNGPKIKENAFEIAKSPGYEKKLKELQDLRSRFVAMASYQHPFRSLKLKPSFTETFLNYFKMSALKQSFVGALKSFLF